MDTMTSPTPEMTTKIRPMILRAALAAAALAWQSAGAQTILWSSPPDAVNLSSSGQPMGGGFRLELGVFEGSFTPTAGNLAEWSAQWRPLQRISYNPRTKRFAAEHTPANNTSPFTIGKPVYVWGFNGNPTAGEWILFRANSWLYPNANPSNPPPPNAYEWFANAPDVTAVIGSLQTSGSTFQMRSASVSGVVPPPTSWGQWRAELLAGEKLDGANDDADGDGVPNQLEFVFGSDPRKPGASPAMPLTLENIGGQKHIQIRIPRRKDHSASLSVQVSSDLSVWNEGGSHVQVIEDGPDTLVVRDLTPYPPGEGRRFMRLRATPTSP